MLALNPNTYIIFLLYGLPVFVLALIIIDEIRGALKSGAIKIEWKKEKQ
jgi:hypothetical protein